MDSDNLDKLKNFLERAWFERTGLISALIIGLITSEALLVNAKAAWWLNLLVSVAVVLSIWIGWWWSKRPPNTIAGRVGFLVGISCDDDVESKKLRSDFLIPLQKLIRSGESGKILQFLVLPAHLANKIIDQEDAEKIRGLSKAHFMLYGRVRRGVIGGDEKHVLDMDCIVRHNPIPANVSKLLANEFNELFPRKVHISTENDILSFYFTSEWTDIVARYVIGIAAAISGDLNYAEKLYLDIKDKLMYMDREFPAYKKLSERLPFRLEEIYEARAGVAHDQWTLDHESIHVVELGKHLKSITDLGLPANERILYLKVIHVFLEKRDVDAAMNLLNEIKVKDSALWNLDMAFLHAYKGDLKHASQYYRNASLYDNQPSLIVHVEDFICWMLSIEPDKYQLHFSLGIFNWKVKGDRVRAIKDFEEFINMTPLDKFVKERELAQKWIAELSS